MNRQNWIRVLVLSSVSALASAVADVPSVAAVRATNLENANSLRTITSDGRIDVEAHSSESNDATVDARHHESIDRMIERTRQQPDYVSLSSAEWARVEARLRAQFSPSPRMPLVERLRGSYQTYWKRAHDFAGARFRRERVDARDLSALASQHQLTAQERAMVDQTGTHILSYDEFAYLYRTVAPRAKVGRFSNAPRWIDGERLLCGLLPSQMFDGVTEQATRAAEGNLVVYSGQYDRPVRFEATLDPSLNYRWVRIREFSTASGDLVGEWIASDYREINGVKIPFRIERRAPRDGVPVVETAIVTSAQVNTTIPPDSFTIPAEYQREQFDWD